jgi:hypothetical protein
VLFAACAIAFAVLFSRYWWFVLDDSYISFRYAQNLAEHGQLTWNLGEDPVEGYTSSLWVLLNAAAIRVGLDPVVFSKVLSLACMLFILAFLVVWSSGAPLLLRIVVSSAVGFSPALALLANQGMETALGCALMLVNAVLTVRVLSRRDGPSYTAWFAVAFLAALCRPDSIAFSAGMFLGLLVVLTVRKQLSRQIATTGLPFLVAGILYMVWRYQYFGYWLPNPSYIKLGTGGVSFGYTITFFWHVLKPYVALALVLLALTRNRQDLIASVPILTGVVLFWLYLLTITPIQGFLWRYAYPMFAPILCVLLMWARGLERREGLWAWIATAVIGAWFVLWPIKNLLVVDREAERYTQKDRVAVAKTLAGLDGAMYTTESGAPPYYSGWKAVDYLGLNSEEIVHGVPMRRVLEDLEPDLVILHMGAVFMRAGRAQVLFYLEDESYVAVAAVHKFGPYQHIYFVNRESALCEELVRRVTSVPDVEYRDLKRVMAAAPKLYMPIRDPSGELLQVCE